jgi:hypothetical protein
MLNLEFWIAAEGRAMFSVTSVVQLSFAAREEADSLCSRGAGSRKRKPAKPFQASASVTRVTSKG